MALEAIVNGPGVYRVVLEAYPEGVYVLIYDSPDAGDDSPCEDHLQDDWDMAKRSARRWGVTDAQWKEIANTRFNG